MNQTSPAATGTTGAAVAALVAILSAMNAHWDWGINPDGLAAIAGGMPVAAHWLAQQYALRQAVKSAKGAA